MKVIYIIGFSIEGNSGKNKATREKARVLKEKVGDDNFFFYNNRFRGGVLYRLFGVFWFDLLLSTKLLFKKNDFIVVQRVLFLPFTRLLLFFKGIKVVSEFHADLKDEIPHLGKGKHIQAILKLLVPIYNLNYKLSHGIIYNHPSLKEKFDTIYKVPSIYSYNGANYEEFTSEHPSIARKKVNISNDKIVFLFLGSVSKWHGVDYLIEIFNEQRIIENRSLFLYIVGAKDNFYTQQIKQRVQNDNVVFIEPVDTITAKDYINASDYCMLPVRQIRISPGSPLKLYDYIACGKPVIAQSDVKGYSDEVENYNLGYSVDFTNPNKSAESILKIIEEEKDFSVNNRKRAIEDLSWEARIDHWIKFLQKI